MLAPSPHLPFCREADEAGIRIRELEEELAKEHEVSAIPSFEHCVLNGADC